MVVVVGCGKSVRRIWFGQVKILLNSFLIRRNVKSWKLARSGEQKPVRMQRQMKAEIFCLSLALENPHQALDLGCIHEFCDGDCAKNMQ